MLAQRPEKQFMINIVEGPFMSYSTTQSYSSFAAVPLLLHQALIFQVDTHRSCDETGVQDGF